jgi:hypothetical protein
MTVLVSALRSVGTVRPRLRGIHKQMLEAAEESLRLAEREREQSKAARARDVVTASFPPDTPPLGSPAQPLARSEQKMITVEDARGLLKCSAQHVRGLARSGKITARLVARNVWEIDRPSVIAYDERRRNGDRGGIHHQAPEDPDGSGGGSRAA